MAAALLHSDLAAERDTERQRAVQLQEQAAKAVPSGGLGARTLWPSKRTLRPSDHSLLMWVAPSSPVVARTPRCLAALLLVLLLLPSTLSAPSPSCPPASLPPSRLPLAPLAFRGPILCSKFARPRRMSYRTRSECAEPTSVLPIL